MNTEFLSIEEKLAKVVQKGGDIAFYVEVKEVRSKAQIIRQTHGWFRTCFGLKPTLKNFTVFEKPGIYKVIGINSHIFAYYPQATEETDFEVHGARSHVEIIDYGVKAGLQIPPHELTYQIAANQQIGELPVGNSGEEDEEFYYLQPMNQALYRGDWDDGWAIISNVWNVKRRAYEIQTRIGSSDIGHTRKSRALGTFRRPSSPRNYFALFIAPFTQSV